MKKTIMTVSARLAAACALLSSTAMAVQASAFDTISGDNAPSDIDGIVMEMRQQLDPVNATLSELLGIIQERNLTDPISADNFDIDAVGAKFRAAGMISDVTVWNAAATVIEKNGFYGFIEEAKVQMSKLDQMLAATETKLSSWGMLDDDDRMSAIMNNDDTNIIMSLAVMQTSVIAFANFAMAGILIFAELSYVDLEAGSLVDSSNSQLQPAE